MEIHVKGERASGGADTSSEAPRAAARRASSTTRTSTCAAWDLRMPVFSCVL
jgi:hypothetical protein